MLAMKVTATTTTLGRELIMGMARMDAMTKVTVISAAEDRITMIMNLVVQYTIAMNTIAKIIPLR